MNTKKTLYLILLHLFLMPSLFAQDTNEKEVLETLLHEFLEGASKNSAEMHNRFWAEDLIYTSSNGERVTKEDIMNSLVHEEENHSNSIYPVYHAEDIRFLINRGTAFLTFRLVAHIQTPEGAEKNEFYNTGAFIKEDGQWKAYIWQATQIPEN